MGIKKFNDFIKSSYSIMENESNHYVLPEKVKSRLTEDGKGNYVFHHYSGQKRDFIKPTSGVGSLIVNRAEASALGSVGGVAQYYTMEGQVESGVGNVQHTILVPKDEVYYFNQDALNFYDEAKERFTKHFGEYPMAFSPNFQAAWISKVANENGFKMIVCEWRDGELRGQTTIPLIPEKENIEMKPRKKEEYMIGDKVNIFGDDAVITKIEGDIIEYKGERSSGSINFVRNPRSIRKIE